MRTRPWPKRWFERVVGNPNVASAAGPTDDLEANPLLAFGAEGEWAETPAAAAPKPAIPARTKLHFHWSTASGIGMILVLAAIGTYVLVRAGWMPLSAAAPQPARVRIETRPAGAEVLVDGVARGRAPLTLSLAGGAHRLTLRRGTDERIVPLILSPGAEVSQYFELAPAESAATRTGRITVATDPSGARVYIDGQLRGSSPLTLSELTPVEHKVSVATDAGSAERTVGVDPGATTSVVFSLAKVSTPIAGWVTVSAPFDVQVFEGDAIVSTGKSAKIMLAAGRHEIRLTSEPLGYQDKRTVEVGAGKTANLQVDAPKRPISANARPWAEVFIDGASVGQTPISNVPVAIGSHDVIFRHPQLGERQQRVVVTVQGPNRIAVDLTKK